MTHRAMAPETQREMRHQRRQQPPSNSHLAPHLPSPPPTPMLPLPRPTRSPISFLVLSLLTLLPMSLLPIPACATSRMALEHRAADASSASCTFTIGGKTVTHKFCLFLDSEKKFQLAWTPPAGGKGAVKTLFQGTPEAANAWACWGVSDKPPPGKMLGADVIVGFGNPADVTQVKATPMTLGGYQFAQWTVGKTNGNFQVVSRSVIAEVSSDGNLITVAADVSGILGSPQTVVWRGGQTVIDYAAANLGFHKDIIDESVTIDFSKGPDNSTMGGTPPAGGTPSAGGGCGKPSNASSCLTTFKGQRMVHGNCVWLDQEYKFKIAWTKVGPKDTVQVHFRGTPEAAYAWAGWGLASSAQGMMAGSDVVVGMVDPDDNTKSQARAMHLGGLNEDSFQVDTTNGLFQVVPGSLEVEVVCSGSVIKVRGNFTGLLAAPVTVIWRGGALVSQYEEGKPGTHGDQAKALATVDFNTGTAESTQGASTTTQKIVHAFFAGVGFGVLMPLGILIARHLKLWADPLWFNLHIGIQLSGYFLGLVGWCIGIWLKFQTDISAAPEEWYAHYCIGVTIFVTSTLQILTPIVKPHKGVPSRLPWNLAHWTLGYGTVFLSIANIFLGFWILGFQNQMTYWGWEAAYIAYVVVWGVAMLVVEPISWYVYLQRQDEDGNSDEDDDDDEKHNGHHHDDDDDDEDEDEEDDDDDERGKKKHDSDDD